MTDASDNKQLPNRSASGLILIPHFGILHLQAPAYLTEHMEHHAAEDLFANNGMSNTAKHAPFPTAAMNMYAIIVHTIQQ